MNLTCNLILISALLIAGRYGLIIGNPNNQQKSETTNLERTNDTNNLYLIDSIKAVIYGPEETDLITLSDIEKPSLDGSTHTFEDLILEKLIYQDAQRYKMLPSEDAVDNHLQAVQRENNLTLDDLKEIFRNSGYTYEEGRNQFCSMTAVSSMLDFRIRSRLIVPDKEIQRYYQEHPLLQEESYQIQRALVRLPSDMKITQFKHEIESLCKTNTNSFDIDWSEPFWINKSELASDKSFITTMAVNSILIGSDKEYEVELFKLINKKGRALSLA